MYSSDAQVETENQAPSEDFERNISAKVLERQEEDAEEGTSYFAKWFELVPPDKPIHEDEYFWHTGQALEADFWTDDEKLDNYLGLNHSPREPLSENVQEEEEAATFPPKLSLSLTEDDLKSISSYGSDVDSLVSDDEERSASESGWDLETVSDVEAGFEAPDFSKKLSDWSEMPSILPKLPTNEGLSMTRQMSDWSQMPSVLPPLNTRADMNDLNVPSMNRFTSDPSDWVSIPSNMIPRTVPEASWDESIADQMDAPTPMWLQNEELSRFPIQHEPMMLWHNEPQREMQFLNVNQANGGFAPALQINPMLVHHAPLNSHLALVQYPHYPADENMVVARQPHTLPTHVQHSVFTTGEFNIAISHSPLAAFVYPSKTVTEVVLHLVFPALYQHIATGTICAGYANSYAIVNASLFSAKNHFASSAASHMSRQAQTCDVVQLN